jgi:hypothetical protein
MSVPLRSSGSPPDFSSYSTEELEEMHERLRNSMKKKKHLSYRQKEMIMGCQLEIIARQLCVLPDEEFSVKFGELKRFLHSIEKVGCQEDNCEDLKESAESASAGNTNGNRTAEVRIESEKLNEMD